MNEKEIEDIECMGNKVVPTTWMGRDMLPMEFAVAPISYAHLRSHSCLPVSPFTTWHAILTYVALNRANLPVVSPDFVAEFIRVLASEDCEGLFGIDTLVEND